MEGSCPIRPPAFGPLPCSKAFMHRLKQRRQSQRSSVSLSPRPDNSSHKRRQNVVSFQEAVKEEVRTVQRRDAKQERLRELESPFSAETPSPSSHDSGGLLCLKTRNGWTSQMSQSQSEDLDHSSERPPSAQRRRPVRKVGDVTAEVLSLKNELMQLHAENIMRLEHLVTQLQELMKERNDLYKDLSPMPPAERRSEGEIRVGDHRQEWLLMEMDRLNTEFDFKIQVVEILRTTLLRIKSQRMKLKSVSQFDSLFPRPELGSLIHVSLSDVTMGHADVVDVLQDSSKSVMDKNPSTVQMNELRAMEREVEDVEGHLKLLNDAIEDEKQENYKLASDNILLNEQLEELNSQPQTT